MDEIGFFYKIRRISTKATRFRRKIVENVVNPSKIDGIYSKGNWLWRTSSKTRQNKLNLNYTRFVIKKQNKVVLETSKDYPTLPIPLYKSGRHWKPQFHFMARFLAMAELKWT